MMRTHSPRLVALLAVLALCSLGAGCTRGPAYMKGVESLPAQSRATLDVALPIARAAVLATLTQNGYAIERTQEVDPQTILEGSRSLQDGNRITEIHVSALLTRTSGPTPVALTARETVNDVVRSGFSLPALLKLFLPYSTTQSGTYLVRDAMIDDPSFYARFLDRVKDNAAAFGDRR